LVCVLLLFWLHGARFQKSGTFSWPSLRSCYCGNETIAWREGKTANSSCFGQCASPRLGFMWPMVALEVESLMKHEITLLPWLLSMEALTKSFC
jgi:hypothetical protein